MKNGLQYLVVPGEGHNNKAIFELLNSDSIPQETIVVHKGRKLKGYIVGFEDLLIVSRTQANNPTDYKGIEFFTRRGTDDRSTEKITSKELKVANAKELLEIALYVTPELFQKETAKKTYAYLRQQEGYSEDFVGWMKKQQIFVFMAKDCYCLAVSSDAVYKALKARISKMKPEKYPNSTLNKIFLYCLQYYFKISTVDKTVTKNLIDIKPSRSDERYRVAYKKAEVYILRQMEDNKNWKGTYDFSPHGAIVKYHGEYPTKTSEVNAHINAEVSRH